MSKQLVVAAALAAACTACTRPAVRLKHWRADLAQLASEISSHHPGAFAHVKEADWRKAIDDLDEHVAEYDDAHIEVGMLRIAGMIGDSHTRLYLPRGQTYPVDLLWFDDGVFVGGADPSNGWAIGKRVTAIGGRSIDDAIATITPLVPHENDAHLRDEIPALLTDPVVLTGTDLTFGDAVTYMIEDGKATKELTVTARAGGVALAPPNPLPLHLQGPTQYSYWNKYVEDQKLLYFQYNACGDDERVGKFADFAAKTLAFADQHPVDRFVIDLRRNDGGDSKIIEPLVDGLASRPALAGRVFVLIGRTTFSSAVLNAIELKKKLGATLVGTPTGGSPNSYGEIKMFELTNSHLRGQYSTKLFSDDLYRGQTVTPDLPVHVTSADWFAGRDPAMDAVLAAPVPHT
jgi:hypothetical protein